MRRNYQDAVTPPAEITIPAEGLSHLIEEGLLAVAAGVGLKVMAEMMAADVDRAAGPKGRHDPARTAVRHGTGQGSVALGGRRVPVVRPRVRAADGGGELPIPTYEAFNRLDPMPKMVLERMLAGASTRAYRQTLEPVGEAVEAKSTSKSAVSRRLVQRTGQALDELLGRRLDGLVLPVVMIDGIGFGGHLCVAALGVDADGNKHPLAVAEGSTENTTLVVSLLTGLRDRGLDTTRPVLVVIDGGKALRAGVERVFDQPVVQRCQVHKVRNVTDLLPKDLGETVAKKMNAAYAAATALEAEALLGGLAKELDRSHPGAAASLREGQAETLTVLTLGLDPVLARSLRSTNAIESMNSMARDVCGDVKRWRDGQMALRWMAAAMLDCQPRWHKIKGHEHLPRLQAKLEHMFASNPGVSAPNVTPGRYGLPQETDPEESPAPAGTPQDPR
jgi:transposase-like protein